ncbi:phage integrase [Vibrio tubiashii]|uniref:phage integrase n=1 Tax=Vibrio tubiashii TaxID=29498 RepID=UPI003B680571
MLGNPIVYWFTTQDYLNYRANWISHHPLRRDIVISPATHNIELKTFRAMFNTLITYGEWRRLLPVARTQSGSWLISPNRISNPFWRW